MEEQRHSASSGNVTVEALSRRFHAVLLRYFAGRGIPRDDAEDLVQEVFIRMVRHRGLAQVENVEGYMFATAANVAVDSFRRRATRTAHVGDGLGSHLHSVDEFTPQRLLEGREELGGIIAALNEMPERMRNIFILARLENLPRAEIAERLGVSKSLVEQQITLATACLADRRRRNT